MTVSPFLVEEETAHAHLYFHDFMDFKDPTYEQT
jgi:hypothetical protein